MKENITLFISLYAALISTMVFLWRIYEFYIERRGNLIISLKENTVGKPIIINNLQESVKRIPEE